MKRLMMIAAAMLLGSSGAWALGTTAGTRIDNNATLSYSAGGVAQPDVNATIDDHGSADSFVVDKKIDMILITDDTSDLAVVPGQTEAVRNFTFKNEGNADQNFSFMAGNVDGGTADYSGGGTDDEEVEHITKITWTGDGNCTGDASGGSKTESQIPFLLEVDENCKLTFVVESTIPTRGEGGVDGKVMVIELNATAMKDATTKESNTSGADDDENVDVVLADGVSGTTLESDVTENNTATDTASDGVEKARSGYVIETPELTVEKTSCVYDDPVNSTNNPKRIPGARIMYVIDIDNNGTADATDVNITDDIADQLLYDTIAHATDPDTGSGKVTVAENVDSCGCTDGQKQNDGTDFDNTGSGTELKVEGIDIASGKHTCVSFTVEIK